MTNVMQLDDANTWPVNIKTYLNDNHDIFYSWEKGSDENIINAQEYDRAILGLRDILEKTEYVLPGYHCTRLTEQEIEHILTTGMQLPDEDMLNKRIDRVVNSGIFDIDIGMYLKGKNQSGDSNRAYKIWFCFFPPYIAGQRGIERFFRSWGGEALYNLHEDDSRSSTILSQIGTPCIVKAYVPIKNLKVGRLDFRLVKYHLFNKGLDSLRGELIHEDYAIKPITPQNIKRVIKFPEPDFIRLTMCDQWKPKLSLK